MLEWPNTDATISAVIPSYGENDLHDVKLQTLVVLGTIP